jgi:hypothetical protein
MISPPPSPLPHVSLDPEHSDDRAVAALIDALDPGEVPLVRFVHERMPGVPA